MKDERKKIFARREAKKMKERMKKGEINVISLQLEVGRGQFRFINQLPWNQSLARIEEHNCSSIKNKDQGHGSLGARE
jgi:hypothetical protein